MTQSWYGPHGQSASNGHLPQTGLTPMHHHRYHQGAPGQAGMNATSSYTAHRSSPTVNYRPPSSASTASTSSYTVASMASGPVPPAQHAPISVAKHHPMQMVGGPNQGHPGHGHHSGMSHHMPTARYPMPPRNGGGHMGHSVQGNHNHMQQMRSYHGATPSSMNQPLRQLSGGNTPSVGGSTSPAQYGPVKPPAPSPMGQQAGNPPLHHPVPYRHHPRMHGMAGPPPPSRGPNHYYNYHQHQHQHQGYHDNARRTSFPPSTPHHPMGAQHHHEAKYAHYQRPMYESPETVDTSLRGTPSPPPPPPSSHGRESAAPTPNSLGPQLRRFSEHRESADFHHAQENTASDSVGNNNAPPKKAAVTEDDDAASILLQLSGVPSQSEKEVGTSEENRPMSTVHGFNSSGCGLLKPIEASLSIDDDTTIATLEGNDSYAPDLTSEPSSDSIDQNDSEFPAWIPENYPTRLAQKYDDTKLNSLHCFLRSELLEIFVVQKSSHKSPTHSPGSSVGRVGLRCVHCAMVRKQKENRDEAPMAVFYPKSIAEIYRLVTSWQRCHLRKCRNLPPAVRSKWMSLRESDKSRGKTHYWITSAKELRLIDCQSRGGGIRFGPNTKGSEAADTEESSTPSAPAAAVTSTAPSSKSISESISELKVTAPVEKELKPDGEIITNGANATTAVV